MKKLTGLYTDTLQVIDSNIRSELLADSIPKVYLDEPINSYIVDFYNHGTIYYVTFNISEGVSKSLVRDNMLQEGELFNLLRDALLVLQTLSTSLQEMAENHDDLLVMAFNQLKGNFEEKFYKAFPHNRLWQKHGCHIVHEANCAACNLLVSGSTVHSLKSTKKVSCPSYFKVNDLNPESVWDQ